MKKTLSIFLSILMLISVFAGVSITASAGEPWASELKSGTFSVDQDFYYENQVTSQDKNGNYSYSSGATIYEYFGNDTNVVIPDTLGGYTVKCLCCDWWPDNVKTIVIPKTVTRIEQYSFEYCTGLTDVYYTGSAAQWKNVAVSVQNDYLFKATMHFNYGSSSETSHTHSWGSKTTLKKAAECVCGLVSYTCSSCGAVKYKVTDPLSASKGTVFYSWVWDDNDYDYELKYKVTGDFKVSLVGTTNKKITSLTVDSYVYYDGVEDSPYDEDLYVNHYSEWKKVNKAYYNKYYYSTDSGLLIELIDYETKYDVTSVGSSAFKSCTNLKKVTVGKKITKIGAKAFAKCTALKSVSGCAGVKSIGDYAFYNDKKLTNVNNSTKTTSIGKKAFANCTNLVRVGTDTGVTTLSKLTDIGSYAFYKCSSLTAVNIPSGITKIGTKTFTKCTSLKKVTGCSGLKTIGNYAFYNDKKMTYVEGCKKVTKIGDKAFAYCSALVRIGSTKSTVTLPKIKTIGDYAFYKCTSISKAALTSSALTSIGKAAFKGCTSLSTFSESSAKLTSIGKQAFYDDSSLKSITIKAANLKKSGVGTEAFKGIKKTCTFKVPSGKGASYKKIFKVAGAPSKITVKKA